MVPGLGWWSLLRGKGDNLAKARQGIVDPALLVSPVSRGSPTAVQSRRATLLDCPRRAVPARWTVSAMPPTPGILLHHGK
jgi:hypothetical protein